MSQGQEDLEKRSPEKTLELWRERDLTQAAADGQLRRAFGIEDDLQQVEELLRSNKNPVLAGESGVGKSALIHELVLRSHQQGETSLFFGKRVIQFSLRQRGSAVKTADDMGPEMQSLMTALTEFPDIVPYFRDIHLAYDYDLEPQLEALCFKIPNPVLGEGELGRLESMLESSPELHQNYVIVRLEEPTLERAQEILTQWSTEEAERTAVTFTPAALEQGLHLAHRFLSRERLPRSAISLLRQTAALAQKEVPVEERHVITRFSQNHRVPQRLVDPAVKIDLREVHRHFSDRVLGQEDAVDAVVRMISLIKAGLSDVRRPFGVFLFAGPTGVGKTHLAQMLAEYLFGSRDRMVRLNMADFQQERDALVLFGDPEQYNLNQKKGVLTQRVAGHPFAVLLLDEFEKAHDKVHDRFLQLFDEGWFINGLGQPVACRSMIIIATSNTGAEVYREHALGFISAPPSHELEAEIERRIHRAFRFEFLNRFDEVVHFRPLAREAIRTIALRELEKLQERAGMRLRNLELDVDDGVLDWLTVHGYDPHYGARFLRRIIERTVTTAIAEAIVQRTPKAGAKLHLSVRASRVVADLAHRDSPEPKAPVRLPVGTEEKTQVLDRARILAEMSRLVAEAKRRLGELDQFKSEARLLLDEMNKPEFWAHPDKSQPTVESYRSLDVKIRSFERLSGPLLDVLEAVEQDLEAVPLERLAQWVENGSSALAAWTERTAEEGASAVWLTIEGASAFDMPINFMEDLLAAELAWCRTLGLSAAIAAYVDRDDRPSQVIVDVEGPGAEAYLEMERGVHRRKVHEGTDERLVVGVVAQGKLPEQEPKGITAIRRRPGRFDVDIEYRARVNLETRGLRLDVLSGDRTVLGHIVQDLMPGWAKPPLELPEVARVYRENGQGAKDPRTGAVISNYKDVGRGRLNSLLEAWRRHEAIRAEAS